MSVPRSLVSCDLSILTKSFKQYLSRTDNWRYLYPTDTNVAIIVLTLKGRLWGHRYLAIITEGRIHDGKIFMATDPKDNVELALHALLDATGDKINKVLYRRYELSLRSKS